jgi:hypothetical protein
MRVAFGARRDLSSTGVFGAIHNDVAEEEELVDPAIPTVDVGFLFMP